MGRSETATPGAVEGTISANIVDRHLYRNGLALGQGLQRRKVGGDLIGQREDLVGSQRLVGQRLDHRSVRRFGQLGRPLDNRGGFALSRIHRHDLTRLGSRLDGKILVCQLNDTRCQNQHILRWGGFPFGRNGIDRKARVGGNLATGIVGRDPHRPFKRLDHGDARDIPHDKLVAPDAYSGDQRQRDNSPGRIDHLSCGYRLAQTFIVRCEYRHLRLFAAGLAPTGFLAQTPAAACFSASLRPE
jgi:hypothetical protein